MHSRADRHDRETFITALCTAVPTATRADALRLLRWGRTYGRLAEAECNGDWPADNGERRTRECSTCQTPWAFGAVRVVVCDVQEPRIRYECPSCRAERIIRETCEGFGKAVVDGPPGRFFAEASRVVAHFQGDPRGYTVRLQIAGAPLDAFERPALAVPTS